jgi:hypothetical protein
MIEMAPIGTFGTYVAPEKENPYKETFEAFAEAAAKDPKTSWTVTIDAAKEITERVSIAEAANALGKTASLKARDDSKRTVVGTREKSGNPVYQGEVTLTFVLVPKHKARRTTDANGVEMDEAPAEDAPKPTPKPASK